MELRKRCQRGQSRLESLRIEPLTAIGTDPVAEVGLGVIANINLKLVPEALFVTDFSAGGAHGKQSAETLDPSECVLQFPDQARLLGFGVFAFADVSNNQTRLRVSFRIFENHGGEFHRKESSVSAPTPQFPMRLTRKSSLFDQRGKTWVRGVDEAFASGIDDLLAGSLKHRACRRICIQNRAIGRGLHNSIHAVFEQEAIWDIAAVGRWND